MHSRSLWPSATPKRIIAIGTATNGAAFCVYSEEDVQALMANAGSGINQEQATQSTVTASDQSTISRGN